MAAGGSNGVGHMFDFTAVVRVVHKVIHCPVVRRDRVARVEHVFINEIAGHVSHHDGAAVGRVGIRSEIVDYAL